MTSKKRGGLDLRYIFENGKIFMLFEAMVVRETPRKKDVGQGSRLDVFQHLMMRRMKRTYHKRLRGVCTKECGTPQRNQGKSIFQK